MTDRIEEQCKWQSWENSFGAKDFEDYKKYLYKQSGVYVISAKEAFNIDKKAFDYEVTGTFKRLDGTTVKRRCSVPPWNKALKKQNGKVSVAAGQIFYVGKASDLGARLYGHLMGNRITNYVSLKLGFKSRKIYLDYLEVHYYCCSTKLNGLIEARIRDKNKNTIVFGK